MPTAPTSDRRPYDHFLTYRIVVSELGFVEGFNNKIRVIQRRAYGLYPKETICMPTVKTANSRNVFQPVRVAATCSAFVVFVVLVSAAGVYAQTTEFTYQGSLKDGANASNGSYDFEFRLFDALAGGAQQGPTLPRNGVAVSNGIFDVTLDFGNQFPGADRFLEIRVRPTGGGAFTLLLPRQLMASTPYSVRSLDTAQLNGQGATFYRDATNINAGTLASARLGQIPTANIADSAVTAAKIAAGQVVKSLNGLEDNVTLAAGANISITPSGNTLTLASTGGGGNAVLNQTTQQAGANFNISGNGTIGGNLATTGSIMGAGGATITGVNSFDGAVLTARRPNGPAYFIVDSQALPPVESGLIFRKGNANRWAMLADNSFESGAVGSDFRINGYPDGGSPLNYLFIKRGSGNVGINTTNPAAKLHVMGSGDSNTTAILGAGSGEFGVGVEGTSTSGFAVSGTTTTGSGVFGQASGNGIAVRALGNAGIGVSVTSAQVGGIALRTSGSSWFKGNTTPLSAANAGSGTGIVIGSLTNLGFIAAYDYSADQPRVLGLNNAGGNVGIGTLTPDQALSVNGNASKVGGGSWLAFSDDRLKNVKGRFNGGLKAVMKLQPLRYEYKTDNAAGLRSEGEHVGFSAQEVEKIIPEAVTKTEQGIRLVNNDPIIWAMLNAIKEQQATIEKLTTQVRQLQLADSCNQ